MALALGCMGLPAWTSAAPPIAPEDLGKPVLDNARVLACKLTLSPGHPIPVQASDGDALVLFTGDGKIRMWDEQGKVTTATKRFGDALYWSKGSKETLEAASPQAVEMVLVEIKPTKEAAPANPSGLPPAFPRPGSKKVLENDRVVVWDYTFTTGVTSFEHLHDKDAIVVYRYDGSIASTTPDGKTAVGDYKAGDVRFIARGRIHTEKLVTPRESVIVAELK